MTPGAQDCVTQGEVEQVGGGGYWDKGYRTKDICQAHC